MKWGNFKKGIDILDKYNDDEDYAISAVHDKLLAGPEADQVSEEDAAQLKKLGWFVDEESWGCWT
jgi:hypothetical protein